MFDFDFGSDYWLPMSVLDIRDQHRAGVFKINAPLYGGASNNDSFWIEGEDLWDGMLHPISGAIYIPRIFDARQAPMKVI